MYAIRSYYAISLLPTMTATSTSIRITSYNVCYTKLLRFFVGVSLFATLLSSISYLSMPGPVLVFPVITRNIKARNNFV